MDKIYMVVICMLTLCIIYIAVYYNIKVTYIQKLVKDLKKENSILIEKKASAEALISVQNDRILQHSKDMVQAESIYAGKLKSIEEKYKNLKKVYVKNNQSCEEKLRIIEENQLRFCSGE